ncbi:MAG: hypothetical protein ABI114_05135 [Rhodanobacter sp.]
MTAPKTASFAEFAALLRVKRSYITALKKADRLVLTEDGKGVQVEASVDRIRATADPSKAGVVARHAAARGAKAEQGSAQPEQTAPDATSAPSEPDEEPSASSGFQHWRERNERAKALAGERENQIAEGKLMDATEVATAVSAAIVQLRARLESLPDTLGPQLAAINDEGEVRSVLAETIEYALEETARQFSTLAKQVMA